MSMNLYFKSGDQELDTWQTPTYITHMCLTPSAYNKKIPHSVTGKPARRALRLYRTWILHQCDGVWASDEAYAAISQAVNDHIEQIDLFSSHKHIEAYMM